MALMVEAGAHRPVLFIGDGCGSSGKIFSTAHWFRKYQASSFPRMSSKPRRLCTVRPYPLLAGKL
jgi:hypothetical protein